MKKYIYTFIILLVTTVSHSQEVCNNGIDDDADGLIDLNDSECTCTQTPTTPPSLIPNASFEDMNYCPNSFSEMDAAVGWVQASYATSDYYNTCGYIMPGIVDAGAQPFPDGNGVVGFIVAQDYKEYIGSCLTGTLVAGTQYTLTMKIFFTTIYGDGSADPLSTVFSPIDMTIFGAGTCGNIPYASVDCPTAPFSPIAVTSYAPVTGWNTITFNFTPTSDVNEIVIGPPCLLPADYPSQLDGYYTYFVVDNLLLNNSDLFSPISISQSGSLCSNDALLTASAADATGLQWYKDGVAIVGQTGLTLSVSTPATYTVTQTTASGCASAEKEVTGSSTALTVDVNDAVICNGETVTLTASGADTYTWSPATGLSAATGSSVTCSAASTTQYTVTGTASGCEGTATATVTVANSDDSYITASPNPTTIENTEITFTSSETGGTFNWQFGDGTSATTQNPFHTYDQVDSNYLVTLYHITPEGCKDTAQVTVIVLPGIRFYVPNAFTPDGDEFNNSFTPVITSGIDIYSYHISVFNRWGETIFESFDTKQGWDGTYHGTLVKEGAYTWKMTFNDSYTAKEYEYHGSVTLVR